MKVTIDKNIPIPGRGAGRWPVINEMEPGDSVGGLSQVDAISFRNAIGSRGYRGVMRKETGGTYRVWKGEELKR